MNNKSTENLIESGGSVEEIHALEVLSLEVKADRQVTGSVRVEKNQTIDVHHKRSSNNFLVEKSNETDTELKPLQPPVPAARKFSLPPIASKRNGKDLKENSNQLTRKQSLRSNDTIEIVNEQTVAPPKRRQSYDTDSESDCDMRPTNSSARNKRSGKMELSLMSKETKKHLGRQFLSNTQANEETTSFISYEEKHEKEDNSEHNNSSNHSSANLRNSSNDENGGKNNEAFIPDDDLRSNENHPKTTTADADTKRKTKSKKKDKKPKSTKKSKSKRAKGTSQRADHTTEHIDSTEERDEQEPYDFKKVIGNEIEKKTNNKTATAPCYCLSFFFSFTYRIQFKAH